MRSELAASASDMAALVRNRKISSVELVSAHLTHIQEINPVINASVEILSDSALNEAKRADQRLASGDAVGPLHGVPISIKDSINVKDTICTAGTVGRKNSPAAAEDAELVQALRHAGAIPIAKTNLPDLLFAYESDNFVFGRTSNPYDLSRTAGGSSGGEAALIAACGSPLGLGSDAAGSVRLPAHFCGIASLKPTSGLLSQTGHVPPPNGIIDRLWSIGPMARYVADLQLALDVFGVPHPPASSLQSRSRYRVAVYTDNGFVRCPAATQQVVNRCAAFLESYGMTVDELRPPGVERAYDMEMGILGADGGDGIAEYLQISGTKEPHPLLGAWLDRLRPLRATSSEEYEKRFAEWGSYRQSIANFFTRHDVVLCPVYSHPALPHGETVKPGNFEGFSYTMAWNVAGTPAAVVRCGAANGLPLGVQVVTGHNQDHLALEVAKLLEQEFGGWQAPDHIRLSAAV